MEIIQTDFSKELNQLLKKYNKTFEVDKSGIYIVDDKVKTNILISKTTTTSEDFRDKLIFINGLVDSSIENTIEVKDAVKKSIDELIQERKQWYLDNEYKEFKDDLPPFIQLKLDTDLRRDISVMNWIYSH